MSKFIGLIILDGFGINTSEYGNAIKKAKTPFWDSLINKYPNTMLGASGMDVGLPDGQMGNSEVGHLNIGAGRVVYQELTRITKSIKDGDFDQNDAILRTMRSAKANGKKFHTFGLLSDGGVHSHIEHLFAIIDLAKKEGLDDIFVHCFLDGRDVPPKSGADYIKQLKDYMAEQNFGKIASVQGRFYAMDRDNRWDRVEKAYNALTLGVGEQVEDAELAVRQSYENGVTDEFVTPKVVCKNDKPLAIIGQGDSILFFNFRPDRAREITRAFIMPEFDSFERVSGFLSPLYVGMTQYDASFKTYLSTAFLPQSLTNTLGEVLANNGKKQLRIAETEKYAHVTFFFNGGVEKPNPLEERILIPSPKIPTYDLKPSMSAYEVAERAAEEILQCKFDCMILNFANCDMVGHTGIFDAAVSAVEAVDTSLKKVVEAIIKVGGEVIITADHGNADQMYEQDGSPFTAHTTNPVPLIIVTDRKIELANGGVLADIAPTMLKLMDISQPSEMTGKALF
ncbi:MAG: 2,3-bisphosphoglycerate-independent phosphoglycerate mutase [Clostridiales bacterium]|nr:2,3-bisphosphoglycerate-independent phosphoglycerate mutase [Clostridiales bacterium]